MTRKQLPAASARPPRHRVEFGSYLRDLILAKFGAISDAADALGITAPMLHKLIAGERAVPPAYLTGGKRTVNGDPKVNRAKTRKRIDLAAALGLRGQAREDFLEQAWVSIAPPEVADIVGRLRARLSLRSDR